VTGIAETSIFPAFLRYRAIDSRARLTLDSSRRLNRYSNFPRHHRVVRLGDVTSAGTGGRDDDRGKSWLALN
ncbi:hypothetical protein, partial [Pseudorhodoplanes sp.]|uniref:hypothetical protein n=1 Tax=Pseudorhodoplanes sp. TaxID=1934341 RepID=UPI002BE7FFBA